MRLVTEPRPSNYLDLPSPFNLVPPSAGWLKAIQAFDPDIVIFPSQQIAAFRMARRARNSGGLTEMVFKSLPVPPHFVPDTQIYIQHRLVPVFALPVEVVRADPAILIKQLIARDTSTFKDGDALADFFDQRDLDDEKRERAQQKDERKARHRESRIAFLYRTGARISLVQPRRRNLSSGSHDSVSPSPPGSGAAEQPSTTVQGTEV